MSPKTFSIATLGRLFAVMVGLIVLAGCSSSGSGGGGTTSGSPAVTLSGSTLANNTLTFTSSVGVQSPTQTVTVTNSGTATLNFTGFLVSPSSFGIPTNGNTCGTSIAAGGNCTISVTFTPTTTGVVVGSLAISDNAGGSPQTVTLNGTGTSVSLSTSALTFSGGVVGSTSTPQSVMLNNVGTAMLTISSITVGGTNGADFALATGSNVCPYTGGTVAAGAGCTVYVTFTPPASGTFTGTVMITDNASGSPQTVSLTGTTNGSNTAPVSVNFGPNGQSGGYYNGIFTTVTVCQPGTTTCVPVTNVLVDTGSVGLRVLSNQLTGVTLQSITDTSGNTLYGCSEYSDLTYTWGPMQLATIQIGGETASQLPGGTANAGVPIQVITVGGAAPNGASCAAGGGGPDNSVSALGANGILGVGNFPQDCGAYCESVPASYSSPPWPYIACNSTSCGYEPTVPLAWQAWNPVSAFSGTDTNGVLLQLPSIPAAGQATVAGTLTFGINTQTNNAIPGSATAYEIDNYGNFASALFYGVSYTTANSGGSFLDSGSNALFVSDPATLTSLSAQTGVTSVVNCTDNGYYCPSSTLNLSLGLEGVNSTSPTTVSFSIANADSLFLANAGNAALNNLGGTSGGTGPSTDSFDLGLPFFFNRTVFVGIQGTSTSYPNGYWAF